VTGCHTAVSHFIASRRDDAGGARSPGIPFGGLVEGIDLAAVPALARSAVPR
jgi:hypothetical protein